MKYYSLLGVLAAMIMTVAVQTGRADQRTAVESLMSESTDIFIKLAPLQKLYHQLAITPDGILGWKPDELDSIRQTVGCNPFDLKALHNNGLDTAREIGFAISNLKLNSDLDKGAGASVRIILPATNPGALHAWLVQMLQKSDESLHFQKQERSTRFTKPAGHLTGQVAEKGDFAVLSMDYDPQSPALLPSITPAPLKTSPLYHDLISRLNPEQHDNLVFINAKRLLSANLETLKQMARESGDHASVEYLEDFLAVGAAIDFSTPDFRLKTAANLIPGSMLSKHFSQSRHDREVLLKIPEKPLLLLSFSMQLSEYYRNFMKSVSPSKAEDYRSQWELFKTEYGVDVEKDIIDNLAGGVNIGMFDGRTITLSSLNTLISLNLKNEAAMRQTIDKIMARVPADQQYQIVKTPIGDAEVYMINIAGMTQLFLGVHQNRLLLSMGRSFFERALAKDAQSGFAGKLTDPALISALNSSHDILLINMDELLFALKNFAPLLNLQPGDAQEPSKIDVITSALADIRYILSTGRLEKNAMLSEFVIKTGFAHPFFRGVADIVERLKPLSQRDAEDPQPQQQK